MIYEPGDLVYYNDSNNKLRPILLLKKVKKNKDPLLEIWDVCDVKAVNNTKIIRRSAKYFILINELNEL